MRNDKRPIWSQNDPLQKSQARRSRTFDTDRQIMCILVVKGLLTWNQHEGLSGPVLTVGKRPQCAALVGSQAHKICWASAPDGHQASGHEETILLEPGEL
jgi:hypothetical protein